mgnify:CR=1 FL=1
MNRIQNAFDNKKAFIGFITAGDPSLDKTEEFILEMEKAGAALVEIGIPFSDPIAEGPVIQEANLRALSAGCTTDKIFDMVAKLRKKTQIPLAFMAYANSLYKYGYDRFCKRCAEVGIDGLIIPDMPFEEKGELAEEAKKNGVDIISLIAPTSADRIHDRISMIAKEAEGFIYVVSSLGVTGVRDTITTDVGQIIDMIRQVTDVPTAVGFGINKPEQVHQYTQIADGAIVGSAIVRIVAQYGEQAGPKIYEYVSEMVGGLAE